MNDLLLSILLLLLCFLTIYLPLKIVDLLDK
jgi:hypothetical protein